MSLQLISNNAYRYLAVVANASKKDIEHNKSKFNAFLRVNRPVPSQFLDFPKLLPEIDRNLDTISKAEGEIAIPLGQLRHGMFWFVSVDNMDADCLKDIANDKIDIAIEKWKKTGTISSLQNIMVCLLIKRQYREAILLAHNIFTVHFSEWKEMFSLLSDLTPLEVSHLFLDCIYAETTEELNAMNWSGVSTDWESYVKQKAISPIVDKITKFLEECKKSNNENPKLRHQDGLNLLEKAQPLLRELEALLKADDITLQSIEDKVYSEILNCSISSYNAVYDGLIQGDADTFRQIAPLCNALANDIDLNYVSPTVAKRITDNKNVINDKCNDIEKTVQEHLAFNGHLCWFCGTNGETHEMKKPYTRSVSESTWNGTKTTTYTKTVTIHICDACQKELDERPRWNYCTAAMAFVVISLLVLLCFDFWAVFGVFPMFLMFIAIGAISLFVGSIAGKRVRKWLDKEHIREFKRDIDDHPLVKLVKSEGFS